MRNQRRIIRNIGLLCGIVCLLLPDAAWSGILSTLHQQVLDQLDRLSPGREIALDIGVSPKNYQENFEIGDETIALLRQVDLPEAVLTEIETLKGNQFDSQDDLTALLKNTFAHDVNAQYGAVITQAADAGFAAYAYGDEFEIRFQVSEPCYAALMHIADTDQGNITFILPNRQFPELKLEAHRVYSTIHDFHFNPPVSAPPAHEIMTLICSRDKIDWFPEDWGAASLYVIAPTDEIRLRSLKDTLERLEHTEWAGKSLPIHISPFIQISPPGTTTRNLSLQPPRRKGAIPPIGATGTTGKGKFFPPIRATGTTGKQ